MSDACERIDDMSDACELTVGQAGGRGTRAVTT